MMMYLEIFGSLGLIALHRIESFRYEAENDFENLTLSFFLVFTKNRQPQGFILLFFFFTRSVTTVSFNERRLKGLCHGSPVHFV